jgi:hypothetical protein
LAITLYGTLVWSMMIDEWPERLEHVTAGWIDQSRRERAEDRQQAEGDERLRQAEERDRKLDERVNALVSAIGELVQKPDTKG